MVHERENSVSRELISRRFVQTLGSEGFALLVPRSELHDEILRDSEQIGIVGDHERHDPRERLRIDVQLFRGEFPGAQEMRGEEFGQVVRRHSVEGFV